MKGKKSCFLLILSSALFVLSANAQQQLYLVDPLEAVFPDTNHLRNYTNKYDLDFPRGTEADVHLLLKAPAGTSFSISATMNGKALPLSCWNQLVDVPVEQNTGLDSRTEMYKGQTNPYVIRRAPFRIYEVIVPLKENTIETKNKFTCLRLSVPAEMLVRPGKYAINIVLKGKEWEQNGKFIAQVYPVKLPALKDSRFFYTNWYSLSQMEIKHGLVRWTETWFAMLDQYAKLMAHGRQNWIIIPSELIALKEGKITLDEDKMNRFISVFKKPRVYLF